MKIYKGKLEVDVSDDQAENMIKHHGFSKTRETKVKQRSEARPGKESK